MAQKCTGFYLVPPSGAWPFIQQVFIECPLGSSAEDQSKVPAATGVPLGEGHGQTVKQINCTRTGAWCSLESLRKMGAGGGCVCDTCCQLWCELRFGAGRPLCRKRVLRRACYDEWALGMQGGTGQTFPDPEPFLQISVGQSSSCAAIV